jgi:hypothetical protein
MWHSRTAAPVVAIVILIPECGVLQICYFYYARVYENVRLYSSFKTEIKCVILTLVSSNKWLIVTVILFHSTVNAVPRIYSSTLTNIRYVRNFCKRCRKILSSVGFVLRSPYSRENNKPRTVKVRKYTTLSRMMMHNGVA